MPQTRVLCLSPRRSCRKRQLTCTIRPAGDSGEASRASTRSWGQARQPDALHAWLESTQHCHSAVPRRAGTVSLARVCLPACEQTEDSSAKPIAGPAVLWAGTCCLREALSLCRAAVAWSIQHCQPTRCALPDACKCPLTLLQVHLVDVALPPAKQLQGHAPACTAESAIAECAASPALAFSVWVGAQGDCGMFAKASCASCCPKCLSHKIYATNLTSFSLQVTLVLTQSNTPQIRSHDGGCCILMLADPEQILGALLRQ